METYSLACQYVGRLQVTKSLTRQDLLNPVIFQIGSAYLGRTSNWGKYLKCTSGRFVDGNGGRELPADPFLWPGGEAREVQVGPWHHLGAPMSPSFERESPDGEAPGNPEGLDLLYNRAMRASNECLAAQDVSGIYIVHNVGPDGSNTPDWARTFDPEGENGEAVKWLDYAEWKLWPERPRTLSYLGQDVHIGPCSKTSVFQTARWEFHEGAGASITWWPEGLIDGAYLHLTGWGRSDTVQQFVCVPDALAALSLRSGFSPVKLLREVQYHDTETHIPLMHLPDVCEEIYVLSGPGVQAF